MARGAAAACEVSVPTALVRQNIREIVSLASGEVPFSPGMGDGSFATEPNAGLCATERMTSAFF